MRIGVNLIPLRPGQMGGAEIYFRDLLAEWLRRGAHEYVLVTADYNHDTLPEDSARCRRVLFLRESGGAGGKLHRMVLALSRRLHQALVWLQAWHRRHVPAALRRVLRPALRWIMNIALTGR